MDSLSVLPLQVLPLRSPDLDDARMIKTATLQTMVEITTGDGRTSGPIEIKTIPAFLGKRGADIETDMRLLETVGRLGSFDVFSLRTDLRSLGIAADGAKLSLSARKRAELVPYMRRYSRPLLEKVFGAATSADEDAAAAGDLLNTADRATVLANLRSLAGRLGLPLQSVPDFLVRYGEVFAGIAYFRSCNSGARKLLSGVSGWLMATERMPSVRANTAGQRCVSDTQRLLVELSMFLDDSFSNLDAIFDALWDAPSPSRFGQTYGMAEAHYPVLGAVLCGLAVKLSDWQETFPEAAGSPAQRLEWVRQSLLPGLDTLRNTAQMAVVTITEQMN